MCTGLGQCVIPTISVLNRAGDASYQTSSSTCPVNSRNFSLLGSSYWGYTTPDVLRIHGMCSYGDW
jgi:hypothetical protein